MKEHNHHLASQDHVKFLGGHRNVSDADVARARILQSLWNKTSQIMKIFVL